TPPRPASPTACWWSHHPFLSVRPMNARRRPGRLREGWASSRESATPSCPSALAARSPVHPILRSDASLFVHTRRAAIGETTVPPDRPHGLDSRPVDLDRVPDPDCARDRPRDGQHHLHLHSLGKAPEGTAGESTDTRAGARHDHAHPPP